MARAVALILALVIGAPAAAQERVRAYPEVRIDALSGSPEAFHAGAGVQVPAGNYVRLGVIAAGGAARSRDDRTLASARGDLMMRFLLDPFREMRFGLSAGAGVSVRYDDREGWRPFLALVLDLEGPGGRGFTPAAQLGLGGGVRVGLALRASPRVHR